MKDETKLEDLKSEIDKIDLNVENAGHFEIPDSSKEKLIKYVRLMYHIRCFIRIMNLNCLFPIVNVGRIRGNK